MCWGWRALPGRARRMVASTLWTASAGIQNCQTHSMLACSTAFPSLAQVQTISPYHRLRLLHFTCTAHMLTGRFVCLQCVLWRCDSPVVRPRHPVHDHPQHGCHLRDLQVWCMLWMFERAMHALNVWAHYACWILHAPATGMMHALKVCTRYACWVMCAVCMTYKCDACSACWMLCTVCTTYRCDACFEGVHTLCMLYNVCTSYRCDVCFECVNMLCMLNAASCMYDLQMWYMLGECEHAMHAVCTTYQPIVCFKSSLMLWGLYTACLTYRCDVCFSSMNMPYMLYPVCMVHDL